MTRDARAETMARYAMSGATKDRGTRGFYGVFTIKYVAGMWTIWGCGEAQVRKATGTHAKERELREGS